MDDFRFLSDRINKLEKDVKMLNSNFTDCAIEQATINEKLNSTLITLGEIKAVVNTLQLKPARKWDSVVSAIIAALISAIIGFIFLKLGG